MATCPDCKREMRLAPTCVDTRVVVSAGKSYQRLRHPDNARERCDDCGVKPGGTHHFGCDMEECPVCGGQLITCGA